MWVWLTIGSAILLGFYDVAKKQSLKKNGVLYVLFAATALSTVFLSPFLHPGSVNDHILLLVKGILVTSSWVSGLAAMKLVPLSTVSTIKASRPVFVLIFSLILFGERLNLLQWAGSLIAIVALLLLSRTSAREGISFTHNRGIWLMGVSILTGVASALFDKYILGFMEPLFVQSWANLYITVLLGLSILVLRIRDSSRLQPFKWDWMIVLIAVFITAADFLYFSALNQEGSLLSVISMVRRSSVVVPFLFGAFAFHEKNIRLKVLDMAVMLAGITLITLGSI